LPNDACSKSQIALEYLHWFNDTYPGMSVFWIHASNLERFQRAFSNIAQECKIPGYDNPKTDVLSLVKAWLESKDRVGWLVILDNADDLELFYQPHRGAELNSAATERETPAKIDLGKYLPECNHGRILITTRNMQVGSRLAYGKKSLEVSKMGSNECNELLRSILGDESLSVEETLGLSERLEHLPLALAQAAAFIQENDISVKEYAELLDEGDSTLIQCLSEPFNAVGRDSESYHAVLETWAISFQQIERQQRLASEILCLLCLFDRQAIPIEYISMYFENKESDAQKHGAKLQLTKAIGVLKAFSFIVEGNDRSFDMHRLVQLITRTWLANKTEELVTEFNDYAFAVVYDAFPYGIFETLSECSRHLPHALAILKFSDTRPAWNELQRADLHYKIGGYYLTKGQPTEALVHQELSIEIRTRIQGADHRATLRSMNDLALTKSYQGKYKEAEALQRQVLDIRTRLLGPEHGSTLDIMDNLSITCRQGGKYWEAEELQVRGLKIRTRIFGEEHPSTLTSMDNIASIYTAQGKYKEAEALQLRVLELSTRIKGPEHRHTLTNMDSLARTYGNRRKYKEAEELQQRVLEMTARILGPENRDTMQRMNNLAAIYLDRGKLEDAEQLHLKTLEMRTRILGEEHPNTIHSMSSLASSHYYQGKYTQAEELQRKALAMSIRVLGGEHPKTLSKIGDLAATCNRVGKCKEAEELQLQVVDKRIRILGEEHPRTLTAKQLLSTTYYSQGKYKEAEELGQQTLESIIRIFGEEDKSTKIYIHNLAYTKYMLNSKEEAIALMEKLVSIKRRVHGADHPSTLKSEQSLKAWQEEDAE
jgi:tetratricopeptide (TPR) repeat protein